MYNVEDEEENMADQRLQWCTKHDDDEFVSMTASYNILPSHVLNFINYIWENKNRK